MNLNWTKIDSIAFAELLRQRSRERGLSSADLAEHLGVSRQLIALALSGRRAFSPQRTFQIAEYLGIEESEIPLVASVKELPVAKGNKIFISYSHKDHVYLDRLMVHLKPLEKQGLIDPWVDSRLLAGDRWKKEIEKALKSARVGILLISADFLASDFIIDNELPPMLQAAEQAGTLIIPVILKPCRFTREKTLCEFQAINPPDEPLSLMNEDERELIYDTVAQRIESIFQKKS